MKFDAGKVWPHPVLRAQNFGDDYPNADFEAEIDLSQLDKGMTLELITDFYLSDPDLQSLVKERKAIFALLIRSPRTHYRNLITSDSSKITKKFKAGDLSGRVEFSPFIIASKDLNNFKVVGWHPDFGDLNFNISQGSVLAEDKPEVYWIYPLDQSPLGSIFAHSDSENIEDRQWELQLESDRVIILMSKSYSSRYKAARAQSNNQPESQYIMNGLYLPALITVLNLADQDSDSYEEFRWYSALNSRLEEVECKPLGQENSNRLVDAQKLLEFPFAKMPIIASEEGI